MIAAAPLPASELIPIVSESRSRTFDLVSDLSDDELLGRAESNEGFYDQLTSASRRLAPLVDPAREKEAWRRLCEGLSVGYG